jgi:CorA-like Mg2+ transporter protein
LGDIDILKADLGALKSLLPELCIGLEPTTITDLFLVDVLPQVKNISTTIRAVSAASVRCPRVESQETHQLAFQLVELVVGDRWLVTCWHRERIHRGVDESGIDGEVPDRTPVIGAVEEMWTTAADDVTQQWVPGETRAESGDQLLSTGDLALLLLRSLVDTYARSLHELQAWLDSWELHFYRRCTDSKVRAEQLQRNELIALRGLAADFRKYLVPINPPRERVKNFWFPNVNAGHLATRVDELIDGSLKGLSSFSDALRSAFDLIQLQMAHIQNRRTERLQEKFENIAAILLVPTLVVGFFGANTALPGGNDPNRWAGFELMLVLIVAGALFTFLLLRFLKRREEEGGITLRRFLIDAMLFRTRPKDEAQAD